MARISIVVPVYYNSDSLPALLERLRALADAVPRHEFEWVLVDDGSGDDSFDVMRELASHEPRLVVARLSRNFGSNQAIAAGLTMTTGDCVGAIAADLQDPPEAFETMIREWEEGHKVVLAVRRDRRGDPLSTRVLAGIFNWLYAKLVFSEFTPSGIGFFLVDAQVVRLMIESAEKNSHILSFILWAGFKRAAVYYDRVEREHGKSRWTLGKKLTYFIDAFVAFSYLPLRVSSVLGLALSLLGFVYAIVIIIARIVGDVEIQGWTSIVVVVLLTSGVQLLILGVLGEYLWRTLETSRRRPSFVVDRIVRGAGERAAAEE